MMLIKLLRTPTEIRQLRATLGISQAIFADRYGFNLRVFRHWEQGIRSPGSHAQLLLTVIQHSPLTVQTAVDQARQIAREEKEKRRLRPPHCTGDALSD